MVKDKVDPLWRQLLTGGQVVREGVNLQQYGPQYTISILCIAQLPTLPDNPGVSRFWASSPGLPDKDLNLPDKRQSWQTLVIIIVKRTKCLFTSNANYNNYSYYDFNFLTYDFIQPEALRSRII